MSEPDRPSPAPRGPPGAAGDDVLPPSRGGDAFARFRTIRFQLKLVMLLAALPGFVILFLHGAEARREARETAGELAAHLARSVATDEGRRFAAAGQTLESVAQRVEPVVADASACGHLLAERLREDTTCSALVVTAEDGSVRAAATRDGSPAPSYARSEWFRRLVERRRPGAGDAETLPGGGLRIPLARPIVDARGALLGVAVASVDLASVGASVLRAGAPNGCVVTLVGADGLVLAQSAPSAAVVGSALQGDTLRNALAARDEGVVFEDDTGVRQIHGFTRTAAAASPTVGRVVVTIPESAALAPANAALLRGAGWMLAVGLVAMVAALRLAESKVLAPLAGLSRAAERLRAGDEGARAGPAYRSGEVGVLQRAFDGMADALQRERRRIEEAERTYRSLVEELPAVLYVLRLDGAGGAAELSYVSPQVEDLAGYAPDEMTSGRRRWLDTVAPEDRGALLDAVRGTAETGRPFAVEHRSYFRDGTVRWLRNTGALVRDAAGRPAAIRGFVVDITERKQLEVQLHRSQKLEAIGQLAAGVAHDFNNLLTVILGYTHLLDEMAANDARLHARLQEIQKAGDRAAVLTHRLLAFTRKRDANPTVLDLRDSVSEIEQMIVRLLGPRIDVRIVSDAGRGRVLADAGHVDQILMNLVVNARDAMPDGGRLTIEVYDRGRPRGASAAGGALPGPYVCVAVSDTGCGMDEATQGRIFEPFFTTKAEGQGTGLGLAIVYALVQQSGGFVAFESEVGKGTTFRVYFPRLSDAEVLAAQRPSALPAPVAGDARGAGTVLVVEDEDGVRALACATFAERGYDVLEASRGDDAVRLAQTFQGRIDALVTDIGLPGMDGREVAARIEASRPECRVLLMSGYAENVVREGRDVPHAAFIAKPFTPGDLARKLAEVVAAGRAPAPHPPGLPLQV